MSSQASLTGFAGGRYRVETLLGEGGSKRVYLARDTRLERDVALALIKTEQLTIVNSNGVHARPAAHLSTLARQFQARVFLHKGKAHAPVTSVTEIMALDLGKGDAVWLSAQGSDASEALAALKALIQSGLGEDLSKAPAAMV